jgi:hypothetical protein
MMWRSEVAEKQTCENCIALRVIWGDPRLVMSSCVRSLCSREGENAEGQSAEEEIAKDIVEVEIAEK